MFKKAVMKLELSYLLFRSLCRCEANETFVLIFDIFFKVVKIGSTKVC
jgi:hypothetical protein